MDRSNRPLLDGSNVSADFLQLRPGDRPRNQSLADWLTSSLRQAMDEGRLPPDARLPSTRTLADSLGISRGVVSESFRRLTDEGRLQSSGRHGTRVRPTAGKDSPRTTVDRRPRQPSPSPAAIFARPPSAGLIDDLREIPTPIDLTPGRPDLSAFPRTAWVRAERKVLTELPHGLLGYPDARGTDGLRRAVCDWLARYRGLVFDPEELIITAGVAQGLTLLAHLLSAMHPQRSPRVATEDPGSMGGRESLHAWGVETVPVEVDADGLVVDQLEKISRSTEVDAVLVTPAHQFPMGVPLAPDRRHRLINWASRTKSLIIEDDYDAEHRYDRAPVAAIRQLAPDLVCYTGSVSKTLSPALRIGWLLPPSSIHDQLLQLKRNTDLGNAVLPQLVLAELMSSGGLERHLRLLRRQQRARRDAMITALRRHLPQAELHGAAAGVHLTVSLPQQVDDLALAGDALSAGVKVHPLSWHRRRARSPGLVLGYAASSPTQIDQGIAVVADQLNRAQLSR